MWVALAPSDVTNIYGMHMQVLPSVQPQHTVWQSLPSLVEQMHPSAVQVGHPKAISLDSGTRVAEAVSQNWLPQSQGVAASIGGATKGSQGRGGRGRRRNRQGKHGERLKQPECVDDSSKLPDDTNRDSSSRSSSPADESTSLKLMEQLEMGGQECAEALAEMQGHVAQLAFESVGCRVVQEALRVADKQTVVSMIAELTGNVKKATGSPHANYVIQKIVELLPPSQAEFIVNELCDCVVEVASHRYGCRIICRLLEHSAAAPSTGKLLDNMLRSAKSLCCNVYGHYVILLLLEHGIKVHRQAVVAAVCGDAYKMAKNRHASHIMIMILTSGEMEQKQAVIDAMVADGECLLQAALDKHAWMVVRAVCRLPGSHLQKVQSQLDLGKEALMQSKYGIRVLQELNGNTKKHGEAIHY